MNVEKRSKIIIDWINDYCENTSFKPKSLVVGISGGIDSSGPYTGESYDAAALITLAMQAGGKADKATVQANVMNVANAPGTKIYPGQLKKALDLLAKGKKVNYEGATGVEFTDVGEAFGSFLEKEIKGGKFKTKKQR